MNLYVMRHGEAELQGSHEDDSRALTERGIADVGAVATLAVERGVLVDAIFCSPRLRCRQTAELVRARLCPAVTVETQPWLDGGASADAILEALALSAVEPSRILLGILLVGHMPDVAQLIDRLCGHNVAFAPATLVSVSAPSFTAGVGTLEWRLYPPRG